MIRKVQGLVLMAGGGGIFYWGYNISQSLNSRVTEAITGAPADKAMYLMIGGGIIAALGFFRLFKAS